MLVTLSIMPSLVAFKRFSNKLWRLSIMASHNFVYPLLGFSVMCCDGWCFPVHPQWSGIVWNIPFYWSWFLCQFLLLSLSVEFNSSWESALSAMNALLLLMVHWKSYRERDPIHVLGMWQKVSWIPWQLLFLWSDHVIMPTDGCNCVFLAIPPGCKQQFLQPGTPSRLICPDNCPFQSIVLPVLRGPHGWFISFQTVVILPVQNGHCPENHWPRKLGNTPRNTACSPFPGKRGSCLHYTFNSFTSFSASGGAFQGQHSLIPTIWMENRLIVCWWNILPESCQVCCVCAVLLVPADQYMERNEPC